MNKLALAIALVAEAFKNTLDKGGQPYILHCLYVMNNTSGNEDVKCAAVLHDLVEDTDESSEINFTFELLGAVYGFSERTIDLLKLLTRHPDDDYMGSYIRRIAYDEDAVKIKKADLKHNSDISRLKGLRKKDFDRLEKYNRAYQYLS